MALETYNDIAAALGTNYGTQIFHQFNREARTLALLTARPPVNKVPAWDVEFTGSASSAGPFAEGADVQASEYNTDKPVPATLGWGLYRTAFHLTETEMIQASVSSGTPAALVNLLEDRFFTKIAKLAEVINQDLYTGDGTGSGGEPTIVGFYGGALGASGDYAGIARGTYPEHAATVLANGGTPRPLTLDLLYQAEEQLFRACGRDADMLLASTGVRRKYAGIFEAVRRNPGNNYAAGGNPTFMGNEIIRDRAATAGKLIMGVSSFVEVQFLPPLGQAMDTVETRMRMLQGSNGQPADRITGSSIPVQITPIAKTGDSVKFACTVRLQLVVKRCNAFVVIEDISEAA